MNERPEASDVVPRNEEDVELETRKTRREIEREAVMQKLADQAQELGMGY